MKKNLKGHVSDVVRVLQYYADMTQWILLFAFQLHQNKNKSSSLKRKICETHYDSMERSISFERWKYWSNRVIELAIEFILASTKNISLGHSTLHQVKEMRAESNPRTLDAQSEFPHSTDVEAHQSGFHQHPPHLVR